ncbi:ERVV1 protein, partial [Dromas ardeola]|nr:ERVV1 protein [Dromas ardeola]
AKEGGLCTVLGEHCCAYVNQDKRIEKDLSQIWEKTKILHEVAQDNTSWGFGDLIEKLTSWLPNLAWLKQLFIVTIIVAILSMVLCVIIRCAWWYFQSTRDSYSEWKKNQLRRKLESNKYLKKT